MELSGDNQSGVMPILVDLYNAQQVDSLVQNWDDDARAELVSLIVNLLKMELSPREAELVTDVLICLMRRAQREVCIELSEKLSALNSVPIRLLMHMANEAIDIARPILRNSPVFNDMDLIYIIKSQSADYWRELAQRASVSSFVAVELVKADDVGTSRHLVNNKGAALGHDSLLLLSRQAADDEGLAKEILLRPELTADIVKIIYQGVGAALQHHIQQAFPDVAGQVEALVEQSVEDVSAAALSDVMRSSSEVRPEDEGGGITVSTFIHYLEKGMNAEFVEAFASYAQISAPNVQQIVAQESGQGLAIICKALNVERRDFIALYLLLTRMRGGMIDPKNLKRATRYFDDVGRDAAESILARIRQGERLS